MDTKTIGRVDKARKKAVDNLVSETLSQYDVVTNELKEKIDDINKVFGNLLAGNRSRTYKRCEKGGASFPLQVSKS